MQSKNFKTCDELYEEISELKSQQRELSCELAKKQCKSIVYSTTKRPSQRKCQIWILVIPDQVLH